MLYRAKFIVISFPFKMSVYQFDSILEGDGPAEDESRDLADAESGRGNAVLDGLGRFGVEGLYRA